MNKKINEFVKEMKEQDLTLALAESITCGMVAEKLATCFGTSDVLQGSIVCYTPEVKNKLLGIPKSIMKKHTCESMKVTRLLAENLSGLIKADVYAALTGLASPGGSETKAKPVGTVFLCVLYKGRLFRKRLLFRGTPVEIRKKACMAIYDLISKKVLRKNK
ncbi:MAG TPA: CinA family protein [Bacteroidia bacterium]|jgi:PncC family amidohydrolase